MKEAVHFSMIGLDAAQPHFAPSTLGSNAVRSIIFFTMTPPNFAGEVCQGDTQMSRGSRTVCTTQSSRATSKCCQYLFDKLMQYTCESAASGARDVSIDLGAKIEAPQHSVSDTVDLVCLGFFSCSKWYLLL